MSGLVGYQNALVTITTGANTLNTKEWSFDNAGNLKIPNGGNILSQTGNPLFAQSLDELSDVNISDLVSGNVLKFNGTNWVAASDNTTGIGNFFIDQDTITNNVQLNPVILRTLGVDSTTYNYTFDSNGSLTLPDNGSIVQNLSIVKTIISELSDVGSAVVWTGSSSNISTAKLLVQAEAIELGDPSGYHNQSCEIIISSRGSAGVPVISVYGIAYTSSSSLVTFTTQRNISNDTIEILATRTGIVDGNVSFRIYSTELLSTV